MSSPSATADGASEPRRVCPVAHGNSSKAAAAPAAAAASRSEPADKPDRPLLGNIPCSHAKVNRSAESQDPGDVVPSTTIPATGRGNSEDGKEWLNPSPNQLHRALRRRDKPIEEEDSFAVAAVHEVVTKGSWDAIMEFEKMHEKECTQPKLARFEGKDGIYSIKARFLNLVGINLPFDRHDWTVDRCGKEVKYIIDYYAIETGEDIAYSIDARPTGFQGAMDRIRLAFRKVMAGESPW